MKKNSVKNSVNMVGKKKNSQIGRKWVAFLLDTATKAGQSGESGPSRKMQWKTKKKKSR